MNFYTYLLNFHSILSFIFENSYYSLSFFIYSIFWCNPFLILHQFYFIVGHITFFSNFEHRLKSYFLISFSIIVFGLKIVVEIPNYSLNSSYSGISLIASSNIAIA